MELKRILVLAIAVLCFGDNVAAQNGGQSETSRQKEVAEKGARIMPFDLARSTHDFHDNPRGGIETVITSDYKNSEQVRLIREHLAHEADRFRHGDFEDPAKIHGTEMPGLATLRAAGNKLQVTYKNVPGGASLMYSSHDKAVVAAVHEWFAAQRADHSAHAHMHR